MINEIIELDSNILLWFNELNALYFDPIMKDLSGRAIWIPFYVAISAMFVWRFGWKKGLILIIAIGVAVGLSDMICARLIRPFFQRLRPAHLDNPLSVFVHIVDGYRGGRYGFPSCHAANSFALAVCSSVLLRVKNYSVFILFWALLLCYTRMYLGVHYPGDLLVGAMVGSLIGYGVALCMGKFAARPQSAVLRAWPAIGVGCATIAFDILYRTVLYFTT